MALCYRRQVHDPHGVFSFLGLGTFPFPSLELECEAIAFSVLLVRRSLPLHAPVPLLPEARLQAGTFSLTSPTGLRSFPSAPRPRTFIFWGLSYKDKRCLRAIPPVRGFSQTGEEGSFSVRCFSFSFFFHPHDRLPR